MFDNYAHSRISVPDVMSGILTLPASRGYIPTGRIRRKICAHSGSDIKLYQLMCWSWMTENTEQVIVGEEHNGTADGWQLVGSDQGEGSREDHGEISLVW